MTGPRVLRETGPLPARRRHQLTAVPLLLPHLSPGTVGNRAAMQIIHKVLNPADSRLRDPERLLLS